MSAGDKVTFKVEGKKLSGMVIAEIRPLRSAKVYVPSTTKRNQIKFKDVVAADRVLVAVPVGRDGKTMHYYCPHKSLVYLENEN